MILSKLKAFVIAAVALAAPIAAQAVPIPISVGDVKFGMTVLSTPGVLSFSQEFVATEALFVSGSASGTGGSLSTLNSISFGFNNATEAFSSIVPSGGNPPSFAALGFFPTISVAAGEVFTVVFESTGVSTSSVGGPLTFTIATAPIPLPAAGWLLISALGGVAVLGRRRRAAAA